MATIKENLLEGLGNVGKTFPTIGKVVGTKMVLKSIKKLVLEVQRYENL